MPSRRAGKILIVSIFVREPHGQKMSGGFSNEIFNSIFNRISKFFGAINQSALVEQDSLSVWTRIVRSWTLESIKKNVIWVIKNYRRPSFILSCIGILITTYVVSPTILSPSFNGKKQIKPSGRPDKYTTGFINTGNDCFANATIQSLVPLWQLNKYFSAMLAYPVPESAVRYPMPLHLALIDILSKLQKPISTNASLSVWDLLHLLETIHQGKISRAQQDAHELLLLLIDTLEDEYLKFFSFYFKSDDESKKTMTKPPHFPFSSIVESKLYCLRCRKISVPTRNPMMMLELSTPQYPSSVSLEEIISGSQSEVIEGYSCFVCMITHIILSQDSLFLSEEQKKFLQNIKNRLASGKLVINDEVGESQTYKDIILSNPNLQHGNLKTTVHRETEFIETPEIIPIHLSRSMYADTQSWRNACAVEFPPGLEFKNKGSSDPIKYNLKSVIRHKGTHFSGHYECYRKKPQFYKSSDGKYFNDIPGALFNDEKIKLQNEEQALYQNKSKKKYKKLASVVNKPYWRISDTKVSEVSEKCMLEDGKAVYMLVYERS